VSANRYNSIVETMKGTVVNLVTLSTFGTVPGLITVPAPPLPFAWGVSVGGTPRLRFDLRDVPNIRSVGMFSNLADGLAPRACEIDVSWRAIDNALNIVGNAMVTISGIYPVALNRMESQSLFREFNSPAARQTLQANIALGATATALVVGHAGAQWQFEAWSMASAWNAAELSLGIELEVEHTFPLLPP
jgi:hypothetical protein